MDLIDIGPVFEAVGYAEVNRSIVLHLHGLGVNIRVKPRPLGCVAVDLDPATRGLLEAMIRNTGITRATVLYTFLGGFFAPEPGCYSIGLTMLECDRLPQDWVERCNAMHEIWVPSTFNRATFTSSGVRADKVRVMPLGVDDRRFHPGLPPLPIPGRRGFTFLSVFEWIPRKAYDILIRAFLQEFEPHEDVCLVIRAHDNSAYDPLGRRMAAEITAMRAALGKTAGPPIITMATVMGPDDLARLYAAADCFVLPTRGEGWNMTAIEAMACGVPAICTNWSAHLEFMNRENSLLIDVECMEPIPAFGIANDRVYAGACWARPSEAHLRQLMRWAFQNRAQVKEIGMRGSRDVLSRFTWEMAARRMYERLAEIDASSSGTYPPGGGGRPTEPSPASGASDSTPGPPGGAWVPVTVIRTVPPPPPSVREITRDGSYRWRSGSGRPLRVCMVVPSWGKRCGIYRYSQALIEGLEGFGVEVGVVPSPRAEALAVCLGETEFDVVHFQYEYVLYNVRELAQMADSLASRGLPTVLTAHDYTSGLVEHNTIISRAFARLVVHSQQAHAAYVESGAPPGCVKVIPMGCTRYELEDAGAVRARLGLASEPAVGFFGFTLPHKGMIELGMAIRDLRKAVPSIRCFMFSAPAPYRSSHAYASRVRETFTRLGLWDVVVWNQAYLPEAEVVNYLAAMDLNVLPYRDHGFIGTSAAARTVMAAGRPMIVTDVPFFSDLGDEVLKITRATPQELARAIATVLGDRSLRERLITRMRVRLDELSWSHSARLHAEMYLDLHASSPGSKRPRTREVVP